MPVTSFARQTGVSDRQRVEGSSEHPNQSNIAVRLIETMCTGAHPKWADCQAAGHQNRYINTLRTGSFKLFKRPFPGFFNNFNPFNAELNPICYLLALLAHHFFHVSRIRVKSLTLRLLMSYIYIYIYIYIYTSIWSAYS